MRLRTLAGFAAAVAFGVTSAANAQYFTEGFDTVVPTGWTAQNYPWPQEQPGTGAVEPLLLPWGGIERLRYAWNGKEFTRVR